MSNVIEKKKPVLTGQTALDTFHGVWVSFWQFEKNYRLTPDYVAVKHGEGFVLIAVSSFAVPLEEFVQFFNSLSGPIEIVPEGESPLEKLRGLVGWQALRLQKRKLRTSRAARASFNLAGRSWAGADE